MGDQGRAPDAPPQWPDLTLPDTMRPDTTPDCSFAIVCVQTMWDVNFLCCKGGLTCTPTYSNGYLVRTRCTCGNGKSFTCTTNVCKGGIMNGWMQKVSCSGEGVSATQTCLSQCS